MRQSIRILDIPERKWKFIWKLYEMKTKMTNEWKRMKENERKRTMFKKENVRVQENHLYIVCFSYTIYERTLCMKRKPESFERKRKHVVKYVYMSVVVRKNRTAAIYKEPEKTWEPNEREREKKRKRTRE